MGQQQHDIRVIMANPPCSASFEVLPSKSRRHAERIHAFIPGFEPDGELLLRETAKVSIQLMLLCAPLYALIFWPQAETGLYSWHPIKRVLILIFLPLVLLYLVINAGSNFWDDDY
jgi:hypothetical protein